MHRDSYRLALGGVLTALAVSVMFLGSLIPLSTYVSPALASFAVFYFAIEFKSGAAVLVYLAISALALLIAPDKEQALLFVCFLGWYPIVKPLIDRRLKGISALFIKLLLCNISLLSLYYVISNVFIIAELREEFAQYGTAVVIMLDVLGNVTFYFYDRALTRLAMLWFSKWKPRLAKSGK